ncbi:unnamed protein product [Paramecium octaurelia]|uniref:Uncharacterized protein n=1 Tax=Paramecium octaurelia TaxID=43137 RepID=A0A8S1Y1X0_PAROT|nr:unnamed protein product [Paramecium octaurelia]
MRKIQNNQAISGQGYQQGYKVNEQVVPQGIAFFSTSGKRHYPDFQRGELESYQGMQHLFDPPKRLAQDYDRSLNTKDIDGAVTNTLRSKVVKNMELAQVYKQEKQKSLWEQSSKPSDLDSQAYQPRKKWEDNDPYKNRSAIYTNYEDSKRKADDLSEKHLETIQYPDSTNFQPNQQFHESQYQQQQLYAYEDPNLIAQRQQLQQQIQLQNSQSQPNLVVQPQNTQPTNQSEQKQPSQQPQIYQYQIEDDRQKQQQLLIQKQWEQQRLESLQKLQQSQNDKIREQHNLKMQQDQDYQFIQEQRQQSLNKKQQYARELRQQQESNKDGSYRKGFTPPPASKSEIIGSLLQAPKMQKSQGFDGEINQNMRDSLSKEIEENDKKLVINRFRPHELQQYIYDMKNGRIGGSKTRNNPTFMSYAGQQLVNQQQ